MRERKMSAAAERMKALLEDIRDSKKYSILYTIMASCISAENNETNQQIAINKRNLNDIVSAIDVIDPIPAEFEKCRSTILKYLNDGHKRHL